MYIPSKLWLGAFLQPLFPNFMRNKAKQAAKLWFFCISSNLIRIISNWGNKNGGGGLENKKTKQWDCKQIKIQIILSTLPSWHQLISVYTQFLKLLSAYQQPSCHNRTPRLWSTQKVPKPGSLYHRYPPTLFLVYPSFFSKSWAWNFGRQEYRPSQDASIQILPYFCTTWRTIQQGSPAFFCYGRIGWYHRNLASCRCRRLLRVDSTCLLN